MVPQKQSHAEEKWDGIGLYLPRKTTFSSGRRGAGQVGKEIVDLEQARGKRHEKGSKGSKTQRCGRNTVGKSQLAAAFVASMLSLASMLPQARSE